MRSRRRRTSALALGAVALSLAGAPAVASAEAVEEGESIQAAIDDAQPGDTITIGPGVFHENLTIRADDLTIRGAGSGRRGTTLMPATPPTPSPCSSPDGAFVHGICVVGDVNFETFEVAGEPVSGTTIEDLTVDGFSGFGVFGFNAADLTVKGVRARDNGGYGISGFVLAGVRFLENVAIDNGEPGFYVGDSPDADAVLIGNTAIRNGVGGGGFGFFLRDSSHGQVLDNRASRNCIGFLFLDTGSPGPVSDWTVKGNTANRNNGACPAGEEGPATSGTGIGLAGTDSVEVTKNHVFGNRPSIESPFAGGIVVISSRQFGGADPTHNAITRNVALHNRPADIVWDGTGSGNTIRRNLCARSTPAGFCGGH